MVAYSAIGTAEGALYVRELESGKTTKLTSGEFTFYPVWSPDGKRIAYFVYPPDSKLAIVELESRKSSVLKGSDGGKLRPLDWSPRGDKLLCNLIRSDKTSALALVSVPEGNVTPLISQGWTAQSTAVFSPDGRFIAFSANEEGNRHIFVLAVDGSRKHSITTGPEGGWAPLFSPEGDTLVFQNDDGMWATAISDGRPHGRPRFLQSKPFDQPIAWTPTLGYTYVAYNRVTAFYSVPVDPQVREVLGPAQRIPVKLEQAHKFAWSPDMKWIALTRYGDAKIHLYSTTEQTLRSFSTGIEGPPSKLLWAGDGKAVLFVPYSAGGQGGTILALNPTDGNIRPLFPRMHDAERFDLSADGRSVLFYRHNGDRNNGRRQLIFGPVGRPEDGHVLASEQDADGLFSNWVRPVFSPDGAQVLLARRSAEKDNLREASLWVVSTDGSSKRKIASLTYGAEGSVGGGSHKPFLQDAVWHPSGRYVAYDDGKSLFVVNVETAEQKQMSLPKTFAGIGVMQWSPDGKQIGLVSVRLNLELWTVENFLPKAEVQAARLEE